MKSKGFTLVINWGGGLSDVTTWENGRKKVQKVQKSVQSMHHFSRITVLHWLKTPASSFRFREKAWTQRSESAKIADHVADYLHDQKMNGIIISWYIQDQN